MSQMPETLKNFQSFVDGRGYAGIVEKVTPPKMTLLTEEHRAGGMDMPDDIDMGMEKPTMSMVFAEYNADVNKQFGVIRNGDLSFTLRGAMERDGGGVTPIVINARGRITEIDNGDWEAGKKTQMTVNMSLRYYKLTIGGDVIHEIDSVNMIRIINGEDQLAAHRDAIGL